VVNWVDTLPIFGSAFTAEFTENARSKNDGPNARKIKHRPPGLEDEGQILRAESLCRTEKNAEPKNAG